MPPHRGDSDMYRHSRVGREALLGGGDDGHGGRVVDALGMQQGLGLCWFGRRRVVCVMG